MTTIDVPARNKRVKKLLELTYPGVKISVTAGAGSAYHWINIKFADRVGNPPGMSHNNVKDALADLIVGAGIEISTFPIDDAGRDFGELPCITIDMPREPRVDVERNQVAEVIVELLRTLPCGQEQEGWNPAVVTLSATTSGCPLIRFEIDAGNIFHITVTRVRS